MRFSAAHNQLIILPTQRYVNDPARLVSVPTVHLPTLPGRHFSNPLPDWPPPPAHPATRHGAAKMPPRANISGRRAGR